MEYLVRTVNIFYRQKYERHFVKRKATDRSDEKNTPDRWSGVFCALFGLVVGLTLRHGDVVAVGGDGAVRRTHDAVAGDH